MNGESEFIFGDCGDEFVSITDVLDTPTVDDCGMDDSGICRFEECDLHCEVVELLLRSSGMANKRS